MRFIDNSAGSKPRLSTGDVYPALRIGHTAALLFIATREQQPAQHTSYNC